MDRNQSQWHQQHKDHPIFTPPSLVIHIWCQMLSKLSLKTGTTTQPWKLTLKLLYRYVTFFDPRNDDDKSATWHFKLYSLLMAFLGFFPLLLRIFGWWFSWWLFSLLLLWYTCHVLVWLGRTFIPFIPATLFLSREMYCLVCDAFTHILSSLFPDSSFPTTRPWQPETRQEILMCLSLEAV